jgi:outer membrane protein assembly factor BamC
MRAGLAFSVALLTVAVSGCSWLTGDKGYFRDRSDDYRKAQVEPPLQVPADLDADALQEIYVIPPITEDIMVTGEFDAPRPAPLVTGSVDELVRIQKLGDEEWMLVSISPGQLWPQVRGYLGAQSMQVARVDARAGLIETSWLPGTDGDMSERYRFRIEQGVQRNTAELHVLQMYQAGDINSWPQASSNLDKEHQVLREVAQFIANNVESATVSMMAEQAINASGKVSMQEDSDGKPMIRLELPYNRAWASMERALRESNFEILDRDRSTGSYYIHYVAPVEEESGWFDWLFEASEEDPVAELAEHDYKLQVQEQGEDLVTITIKRQDGERLSRSHQQSILALIKGKIS